MQKPNINITVSCLALLLISSIGLASGAKNKLVDKVLDAERIRIDSLITVYWNEPVQSVTDTFCIRSAGSKHDFYSEGDYWWPNPENPDGPYIRKDGWSNPNNFSAHRHAMVKMSRMVGAFTSAYLLTGDEKYAAKAMDHLRAWFITDSTAMSPNMLYAQAINGLYTGRGIGLIDGLHLVEVARSASLLEQSKAVSDVEIVKLKKWFSDFLNWMQTHEYGKSEMSQTNNHGTCWAVQAAAFAQFTGNDSVTAFCANRYKTVFLPDQMNLDGSFPLELKRTKPYGYSLFNIDAMSVLVQILSSEENNYWNYETPDGKGMEQGLKFIYPYIVNKMDWPHQPDVLYWNNWPVRQPSLVLAALAFKNKNYFETWLKLESDPIEDEVQRNLVIRYPVLWISGKRKH